MGGGISVAAGMRRGRFLGTREGLGWRRSFDGDNVERDGGGVVRGMLHRVVWCGVFLSFFRGGEKGIFVLV
jgi:hypothetical protein